MTAKSTYQIFVIAPELMADRTLSLTARVVLGRLGGYTKRGQQTCWPTNQALADECGLAIHSVSNAIKELCQRHIIETKNSLYKGKKTRYITIVFNSPAYDNKTAYISDSSSNELSSNENSTNEQSNSSSNELSDSSSNELSYIYTEESTKEVQEDRENSLSQSPKNASLDHQKSSVKDESAKIKQKKLIYPENKDDCLKIFEPVFHQMCNEHPELEAVDMKTESHLYFNHYQQRNWQYVRDLQSSIESWLLHTLKFDKPQLKKSAKSKEENAQQNMSFADQLFADKAVQAEFEIVESDDTDDSDTPELPLPEFTNNKERK